jgi:hypothetical protein
METANFVLGVLCGTVLCGLCYVIVELLKINKRQNAKENEIAEAFRQLQSVEKEFENMQHHIEENSRDVHSKIDEFINRSFQEEMQSIHQKINENIDSIYRSIEDFKKVEFHRIVNEIHGALTGVKLELREKDSAMKSYIDSRIDKSSRGIELVVEGLKNYFNEDEFADRVLSKVLIKQKEENMKRITEGLPVAGAPTHYGK